VFDALLKAGSQFVAFEVFLDLVDEDSFGVRPYYRNWTLIANLLESLFLENGLKVVVKGLEDETVLNLDFPLVFEHLLVRQFI
jgi:hypothetical protein